MVFFLCIGDAFALMVKYCPKYFLQLTVNISGHLTVHGQGILDDWIGVYPFLMVNGKLYGHLTIKPVKTLQILF